MCSHAEETVLCHGISGEVCVRSTLLMLRTEQLWPFTFGFT